ncbi:glutamate receptor ionotropic, kainate 2-like [Tubulanus polymorphus]|uniref:glutamate receptor ionotropic, kainate 2-like n=1 Tax=Tubulanus polymorphus TaxID=672921 RepID=UPI003DA68158
MDLSDFRDIGGKIRFYRLVDPSHPLIPELSKGLKIAGNTVDNRTDAVTISNGLTGQIEVDDLGRRIMFTLRMVDANNDVLGYWDPNNGLAVIGNKLKKMPLQKEPQALVVTTIMEAPFVMLRKPNIGEANYTGNDRFEGFCIDMIRMIAEDIGFNYTIRLVADGKYGAPVKNGWNGMVRELMDQKADLAVAPLTISYDREQVIDFTKPYMNLGITILGKKPAKPDPKLFSFLSPFSDGVWALMLFAYIVISLVTFVIGRFTPYEWQNPHPCDQNPDELENQFTFRNSFWFTIGSLMQQGSEIAPIANSTRVASGFWWFFTLIMISSYTANLAAFLTIDKLSSPINDAEDLSKQTDIKYGTIWGGSSHLFFRNPIYARMWHFMKHFKREQSVMVDSTQEGVDRVKKGGYAFLLESTTNEYFTERNCDLFQIGSRLDSKGYGVGTRRGSPYRDVISDSILKLQEQERLAELYEKWWRESEGAGMCDEQTETDANELGILNVAGVFFVLFIGTLVAIVIALFEFVWHHRRSKKGNKLPLGESVLNELKIAARCNGSSTRPAEPEDTDCDKTGTE